MTERDRPPFEQSRRLNRPPWLSLAFALGATIALILTTTLSVRSAQERLNVVDRQIAFADSVARVTHLDEVLTTSSMLYSSTGDPFWRDRYAAHLDPLSDAIDSIRSHSPGLFDVALGGATDDANQRLVALEERAMSLAAEGDTPSAIAVLRSDEYAHQKALYAEGNTRAKEAVQAAIQSEALAAERRFAVLLVAAYAIGVASSLAWLSLTRSIARYIRVERHAMRASAEAEAARQASDAKSAFLANMSHEIRTPMTAILGYADLLVSDDAVRSNPEQAMQLATSINANGKHLLSVINDILDVSKIEAGQMTVESLATDPVQIAEEVASLMRPKAMSKGIDFCIRYRSDMPASIESDPTRLRQILLNLTSNAIKFTSSGSVAIEVELDREALQLIYRVVDTGEGMTSTQRDNVARFEAFRQADASMTRRFGGTGLGLRISNALATMLGGGIEVDSTRGQGSTFTVRIATGALDRVAMRRPDQIMPSSDPSPRSPQDGAVPSQTAPPLAGLRILLAEDGPDNQRLISFHLKKAGAEVVVCENGRIACETILVPPDGRRPDVVLMDMQMPEMDGYEATRTLRAKSIDLPIVALTAHAMSGDRERCISAGCTEYLTKPIDKAKLIESCSQLSARRHRLRNAA